MACSWPAHDFARRENVVLVGERHERGRKVNDAQIGLRQAVTPSAIIFEFRRPRRTCCHIRRAIGGKPVPASIPIFGSSRVNVIHPEWAMYLRVLLTLHISCGIRWVCVRSGSPGNSQGRQSASAIWQDLLLGYGRRYGHRADFVSRTASLLPHHGCGVQLLFGVRG
jgi:hypothetical protein